MDFQLLDEVDVYEMVANVWRPTDYEVLNKHTKLIKWFYWQNITYSEFLLEQSAVGWS